VVLVFRLTGSGLDVGMATVVHIVPLIVFGFFAGAVADRLPRVKVMVLRRRRGLLALSLVVAHDSLCVLYAVACGLAASARFGVPSPSSASTVWPPTWVG